MPVLKAFRLRKKLADRLSSIARTSLSPEKYYVEEALRVYVEECGDARVNQELLTDTAKGLPCEK